MQPLIFATIIVSLFVLTNSESYQNTVNVGPGDYTTWPTDHAFDAGVEYNINMDLTSGSKHMFYMCYAYADDRKCMSAIHEKHYGISGFIRNKHVKTFNRDWVLRFGSSTPFISFPVTAEFDVSSANHIKAIGAGIGITIISAIMLFIT